VPTIFSNGCWIRYDVAGEGPTILLVHGFMSNLKDNWQASGWFRALTRAGRRVVAIDCRGHGESDKPHEPEAYAMQHMAADVSEVIAYSNTRRPALMGYSMGGRIALELLATQPKRFRSGVILGGVGARAFEGRSADDGAALAEALLVTDPSRIESAIGRGFRAFADRNPDNDRSAFAACVRRPGGRLDPALFKELDVPVLVVMGEKDDTAGAERLAEALPGAQLEILPGQDHLSAPRDPRYQQLVLDFLGKQAA
jgi:pimeloyl-ACP methyl ester carboxylesterase